jgi:uncharacterized protein YjiS (DUF1127 family)
VIVLTDLFASFGHLAGPWCGDHTMLTAITRSFRLWCERRKADHELAALDDRMLEDIGLCRYELDERHARLRR